MSTSEESKKLLKLRVYSFLLDLVAITAITKAMIWSYSNFVETFMLSMSVGHKVRLLSGLDRLEIVVYFVTYFGHYSFNYLMMDGQTPGMLLCGVQAKNGEGTPLTLRQSLLRAMGHFVCHFMGSFPLLIPFFSSDRRGIPDWISGTSIGRKENTKARSSTLAPRPSLPLIEMDNFPGQVEVTNFSGPSMDAPKNDQKQAA